MIPVARPSIGEEELNEVKRVFNTGWLGMGSWVFEFENALKAFLGAKHAIAVNTGTSALHIALDSLGLKKGSKVIVPSFTFAATIQAIISCGAQPVFCDVDYGTLNMDIKDIKKKISPEVRVIMPVHYGGLPCDMDEILSVSRKNNIIVIEDAAHAFGSNYKNKKIGSFGDITCFSFDPIKNITCGEGGAVVLNDDTLANEIIKKRILGIDKDTWHRYRNERSWFYEVVCPGFRYHMSNINAAIGLVQLKKIGVFLEKRKEICRKYDAGLKGIKEIEISNRDYDTIASFNYVIKIKDNRRDGLMDYLKEKGIDSGIHYIPNHIQPAFKEFHCELAVTEDIFKKILSLPLYPDMEQSDVLRIIDAVKDYFKYD